MAAFDKEAISRWMSNMGKRLPRKSATQLGPGASTWDQKNKYDRSKSMDKEKKLLHDVFPVHIADQLKEGKKVCVSTHANARVCDPAYTWATWASQGAQEQKR